MHGPMGKVDLHLDWATHEAARFACEHWHYAKRSPVGKTVKIGVWEDGTFKGVLIFSPGAAGVGVICQSLGLPPQTLCELQRVALRDHVVPVTRIISIALRLLRTLSPKLEMVVSYADPSVGHEGTIYKASNWFRWGYSASDKSYKFADGKVMHSRSVSETGMKKRQGRMGNCRRHSDAVEVIELPPKYRFLYPLGGLGRSVIENLRAKQATDGNHPDGGGAAPTRALQSVAAINQVIAR